MLILIIILANTIIVSAHSEPSINLQVVDAEVRDVLVVISKVGQVSIIADDSVKGKISLCLNDVPLYTALDLITKASGLSYQVENNTIIVSSSEKLAKNFSNLHIIKLQYANAPEIKSSLSAIISEDRLKIDTSTNSIVFTGTASEAEKINNALKILDIPFQQVSLEAQVLAINKDSAKNLGIEWEWDKTPTWPKVSEEYNDGKEKTTKTRDSSKGIIQFGRTPDGFPYEFYYQAKINALITNGNAKLLAKPKVQTIDGKEAVIFIGDHIPVVTEKKENGETTYSTEYVDAGIKLTYTPQINANGYITAKVHTEVSTPTLVTDIKNYKITTRQADTTVRMKNGETMVIGGLIGKEESSNVSKIPFLGDLPIIGQLFRNTHNTKSESEIVIFLTAKIIGDGSY